MDRRRSEPIQSDSSGKPPGRAGLDWAREGPEELAAAWVADDEVAMRAKCYIAAEGLSARLGSERSEANQSRDSSPGSGSARPEAPSTCRPHGDRLEGASQIPISTFAMLQRQKSRRQALGRPARRRRGRSPGPKRTGVSFPDNSQQFVGVCASSFSVQLDCESALTLIRRSIGANIDTDVRRQTRSSRLAGSRTRKLGSAEHLLTR